MNFGHPKLLWLGLALLPLLALFLWATWRRRQALIRQFVQHKTLAQATLGISVTRQKIRRVLLFVAVAFLLVTIARPQWGFTWEEASQRGRDIIVAIDTSRSMLATDIQPYRLTRAKLAALDLLKLGKFDRFGLVAFAGSAFLQCPLTFDDEAFRQSVQILQTGIIPQGGTAIGPAIQTARDAFGEDADENHRILILFTDGEDHERGVDEVAADAAETGMRIFTIGVGTPAGELLRVRDEQGNLVFVKDDAGNVVKSRLNEEVLREIATRGQGFYLQLQGGNTMELLYEKGLAPLPTSERTTKLMKRFKEQFYWPLAAAILLLILEVFIPDQKRASRPKPENTTPTAPVAAAVSLLLLLLAIPNSNASAAKAQRYYRAGEYNRALSEYQVMLDRTPNDARLHYNSGAAAYQANKFDLALKEFQAAASSPDLDLQQQSFYNLGNAEYRLGEGNANPQEKIAVWEQAVQHYEAALKLNPNDKDAEFNRDFVRKKLEELKQQQRQQEQKQNQNKDNQEENRQDQDDSSKDQQKQDNKDQQKQEDKSQQKQNSQNQKQDNQSEQDQKKSEEEKQKQQQRQEQKDKADQSQAKQGGEKEGEDQKPESASEGAYAQLGQMTPAQAKQLLDAQRDEEKALIFVPQERKSDSKNRSFKDW